MELKLSQKNKNSTEEKALLKQIEKAFDEIEGSGRRATVVAIKERVSGSYSKLCPVIREVKARREQARQQAQAAPKMPEAVKDLFKNIWTQACRSADENDAVARKSLVEEIARKDSELKEQEAEILALEQEKERLESELIAANDTAHEQQQLRNELEGVLNQRDQELAIANAKLEEREAILSPLIDRTAQSNHTKK